MVETLISSGAKERPAALVRYPVAFDQLIALPDWLTRDAFAEVAVRAVRDCLARGSGVEKVVFNVFKSEDETYYRELLQPAGSGAR